MKGKHHVRVSNGVLRYDFDIQRNITIIKGDSATGKTTLVEMIGEYYESGPASGVELVCDKECRTLAGRDWKMILPFVKDSIVFIDEDNEFLPTPEFAEAVRDSDNYYVIVTRESLPTLPYSVDEIYGIRTSGKYAGLNKTYQELYHIYTEHRKGNTIRPDAVIVEDSNSGYEFFSNLSEGKGYNVVSAGGKSKIFDYMQTCDGKVVIVADGAAFGAEMDRITKAADQNEDITLFLPESFEWLILNAGIPTFDEVQMILDEPYQYIESSEYFSWERFFTHLLIEKSEDTFLKYSKRKLNPAYLKGSVLEKILDSIKDIEL
ncbi:MAG: translation initiation factor 2 [Mogibacterium sp.]|nr:translation initiation factor 2 [Mogibacterium sp.]